MRGRLKFEINTELEPSLLTARAGLPSLIEAYRLSGTSAVVDRTIKFKTRKRGLTPSEIVESHLALWATGGERAEDFDHFRQDKALAELLGHELPAAQTARDFLSQFHEADLPLLQDGKASVPSGSAALQDVVETVSLTSDQHPDDMAALKTSWKRRHSPPINFPTTWPR